MRYTASNLLGGTQQNLSTAYKTIISLTPETGNVVTRGRLMAYKGSFDAAPADNTINWDISRQTAAGTATAVTPNAQDTADAVARTAAEANYTVEGTITANSSLDAFGANQRATVGWVARDDKSGLVWPATDENGLAIRAKSPAYASTVVALVEFEE